MKKTMFQSLIVALFCLGFGSTARPNSQAPTEGPKFFNLPGPAAVEYMGYKAESYSVKSEQPGYVIGAYRMINPLANPANVKRAILFDHGLTQDSVGEFLGFAAWARPKKPTANSYSKDIYPNASDDLDKKTQEATAATYEKLCLPCLFADNNYDVWIMDYRGSSRASEQFDQKDFEQRAGGKKKNYWDFSMDEEILYDLPATIDFIRAKTGFDKISYLGFSLGTIEMFALLSMRPEISDKLEAFVSLAPVFYLSNLSGLFPLLRLTDPLLRKVNRASLSYDAAVKVNRLISFICGPPKLRLSLCKAAFEKYVTGPDRNKINIWTDAFMSHLLAPYSIKIFVHVGQIIKTGKVSTFNHAKNIDNILEYGSETPVDIEPKFITHKKMILVRSESDDYLSNKADQEHFINDLTVPLFEDIVTPGDYNHISFFLAKNCYTQVFVPTLRAVNRAYETEL